MSIESANFIGKNQTTIYIAKTTSQASSLAVSKDYFYWQIYNEEGTWQLPKNSSEHVARKLYSTPSLSDYDYHLVAANYTIQEQIEGIQNCEALQGLMPNNTKPECTVSICQNYCLEGNCSVNAGGQPTCSCKAGYSGKRCEVYACHQYCLHNGICALNKEDEPVCKCTADYVGDRCEASIRKDKCASAEEVTKPRSNAGNSEERKISACHQYCLHNGVCSLNGEDEPSCRCTADYEGDRCELSVNNEFHFQADCSVNAEGRPTVIVTVGNGEESTCALNVV
ncbi:hypothetical protein PYW07_012798 [Mythimna separata]|uniref:EGF-like domain-containing protein n=1 Tax=Mythimna separata TaxID=271217 RepID=A0AAD7Y8U1_MYTSE|nr:hypothetical protein PYW07_012798 [Mythimna separata]